MKIGIGIGDISGRPATPADLAAQAQRAGAWGLHFLGRHLQLDRLAADGVTEFFGAPYAVVKGDDTVERTYELLAARARRV